MKTFTKKQNWIILPVLICSINLYSQVFWTENFGTAVSNGNKGVLANGFNSTNGVYTLAETGTNGSYPNLWYVSSMEAGMGAGNCSSGYTENNSLTNNTLHISHQPLRGNLESSGDFGAVYSKGQNRATDSRIETAVINCTGKSNIRVNFDYFTIADEEAMDGFSLYYFDGTAWTFINKFGQTQYGNCDAEKQALWKNSDFYTLPSSANNNPNVKIGFRWTNSRDSIDYSHSQEAAETVDQNGATQGGEILQNTSGAKKVFSVAIDNITISGSTYVDPNNNVNRTANTNKIDIKTVADASTKATIIFTTYSEKFPANNLVIESGMDGVNFTELTQIKSKATEGKITKIEYSFTDVKATEDLKYYRVKQFNADKRVVISPVVSFPVNAQRTANTNKIDVKTEADANNKATIIFTTYSEKFPANNLVIESGMDGVNFTELTQLKSKATEGKITKIEYSFTDVKATEDLKYYRVKQFNADKRVVISPVVSFPVNAQRTANTNKIDIKTVADKKSNPNIVFTTYSEKFPANDLIVESSTDGTDFNELSKIKSKAVKGGVTKLEYNFTDADANDGVNYYRIKQVNADKTTVISKIVSVDHIKAKNITFTVYPNPNSGQFTVDFSGIENNHEVQIVLNDMNDGHEIYSTTFYSNSIDSNKMDVNPPTKIAPGRYICSLIFEGIRSSVIVMIN